MAQGWPAHAIKTQAGAELYDTGEHEENIEEILAADAGIQPGVHRRNEVPSHFEYEKRHSRRQGYDDTAPECCSFTRAGLHLRGTAALRLRTPRFVACRLYCLFQLCAIQRTGDMPYSGRFRGQVDVRRQHAGLCSQRLFHSTNT